MLFSSPVFFGFFVIYFLFHLITPRRARIVLIIVGSTIFYAWWKVSYVWLPYLLMAIAYFGVLWIEAAPEARTREDGARLALSSRCSFRWCSSNIPTSSIAIWSGRCLAFTTRSSICRCRSASRS